MKKLIFTIIFVIVIALLALTGCGRSEQDIHNGKSSAVQQPTTQPTDIDKQLTEPEQQPQSTPEEESDNLRTFTLEELKNYDGKDGRAAYIAIDGKVYDVSDSARWRKGTHNGFAAGNDLTSKIKSVSPHGERVLNNIPIVGVIED